MHESLYSYIWDRTRRDQMLVIGLSLVVFPLSMVPLELQRRIINEGIGEEDLGLLSVLAALYAATILVQGALKFWMNLRRARIGESLIADLRTIISHGNLDAPPTRADARDGQPAGTTVAMVSAEVEPLGGFAGESFSVPIVQAGVLTSVMGYMVVVEPYLALAGLGIFLPQMIVIPLVQMLINRANKKKIKSIRDIGDDIIEAGSEGASSGSKESEKSVLADRISFVYRLRLHVYRLKYAVKLFRNILNHLAEIMVLLVGGWMVIGGQTELGTIVAFLAGLQRVRDPWRDLVAYYRQASDARVKYRLIRSALDETAPSGA